MFCVLVKVCFCPDNNWSVDHVGSEAECIAERDGNTQGVRAWVLELKSLSLHDVVKGGVYAPVTYPEYRVVSSI
jgi:hypothetical protein